MVTDTMKHIKKLTSCTSQRHMGQERYNSMHSYLLTLDRSEWSAPSPNCFSLGQQHWYTLDYNETQTLSIQINLTYQNNTTYFFNVKATSVELYCNIHSLQVNETLQFKIVHTIHILIITMNYIVYESVVMHNVINSRSLTKHK